MSDEMGLSERLRTIPQFVGSRPAFTVSGLRWLVFMRGAELEAAGALIRMGRGRKKRILIDPQMFDAFLAAEGRQR